MMMMTLHYFPFLCATRSASRTPKKIDGVRQVQRWFRKIGFGGGSVLHGSGVGCAHSRPSKLILLKNQARGDFCIPEPDF